MGSEVLPGGRGSPCLAWRVGAVMLMAACRGRVSSDCGMMVAWRAMGVMVW